LRLVGCGDGYSVIKTKQHVSTRVKYYKLLTEYLIEFKWTNLEDNIIQLIKNYRFKEVNQLIIYSQSGILYNIVVRPHIRWNWVIPFKPEMINSKDGVEKTSIHLNFSIHFFCPDQQINFLENNN
jgi:hypothetical protein